MYSSDAVHGSVVDAVTGRPIEGAVVVALWRKIRVTDGRWDGIFRSSEATTDAAGEFTIPRWGPRPVESGAYLDTRDPELWVLRRGYLLGYFDNEFSLEPKVFSTRASQNQRVSKPSPQQTGRFTPGMYMRAADGGSAWNGKTLKLHATEAPAMTVRSLESAAPLDLYEAVAVQNQLPLFWAEWIAARDALDPAWRARVEQPLPLMQRPPSSTHPMDSQRSRP
jgi:hypothetical protein